MTKEPYSCRFGVDATVDEAGIDVCAESQNCPDTGQFGFHKALIMPYLRKWPLGFGTVYAEVRRVNIFAKQHACSAGERKEVLPNGIEKSLLWLQKRKDIEETT